MKSLSLLAFSFSLMFTGCTQEYNNVTNIFVGESTAKVGVKKAYITEKTDAKSKIVSELKLDDELRVIEFTENKEWFKVLTPNKEGFIPRSSMIEVTITDSAGKALSGMWGVLKGKDSKDKTTFDSSGKNWSDEERADRSVKNFGNSQTNKNSNNIKYKIEDIDKLFSNMTEINSNNQIANFRKEGGLK